MTTQVVNRIVEEAHARGDRSVSAADVDGIELFLERLSADDPLTYDDFLSAIDVEASVKADIRG